MEVGEAGHASYKARWEFRSNDQDMDHSFYGQVDTH